MEKKLMFEAMPQKAWYQNLRTVLRTKDWDSLRHEAYAEANGKCQICGAIQETLDAHEVWDFDLSTKTQKLMGIKAVCKKCHLVLHYGRAQKIGRAQEADLHFMEVNNCEIEDLHEAQLECVTLYNERNKIENWNLDITYLQNQGIKPKE